MTILRAVDTTATLLAFTLTCNYNRELAFGQPSLSKSLAVLRSKTPEQVRNASVVLARRSPNVKALDLSQSKISIDDFKRICVSLKNLRTLLIPSVRLVPFEHGQLLNISFPSTLQRLDISYASKLIDPGKELQVD